MLGADACITCMSCVSMPSTQGLSCFILSSHLVSLSASCKESVCFAYRCLLIYDSSKCIALIDVLAYDLSACEARTHRDGSNRSEQTMTDFEAGPGPQKFASQAAISVSVA